MDIEQLALRMRQSAIDQMTPEERKQQDAKAIRDRQLQRIKQLYFNAGRYAGGARDKTAKAAFQKVTNATN